MFASKCKPDDKTVTIQKLNHINLLSMFSDLVMLHQKGSSGPNSLSEQLAANSHWFVLPTCLRQIAIGPGSQVGSLKQVENFEVFEGGRAYHFLLEVICGLRSPLVGETEIFGQFKTAATQFENTAPFGSAPLRKFLKAVNEDAKRIRELHLKDLGSQSYGSLVRRELKGLKQIHIIGAGQLTAEILPWLAKDGAEVHVHARDLARARTKLSAFPQIQFHLLSDRPGFSTDTSEACALIVAAPVDGKWLTEWSCVLTQILVSIDLRGDCRIDRAEIHSSRTILLNELFERITANQNLLQERKDRALKEIIKAVSLREQHVEYRPFGWEDVCA